MFIFPWKIDTSERICLFFLGGVWGRVDYYQAEKEFYETETMKKFLYFWH